ncbi:acetyltransferase [Cypionkella aquatica]|uniref:Acetyltransferase n=1 Tax=Cypionkella aquatica TaxID=1756042 RepID=A0AA37U8J3_9RHOB|nr:acetyltransferase [Cypionkella aquatica]GLS88615.1 acetyltransferase [Cypionkella aquatica]GLS88675.1 acetyltransferase [Cypionkella aquatica]
MIQATTQFDEITVFGARGHSLVILQAMEEHWQGRVKIHALIDDIEHGFRHPALDIPVISSGERRAMFGDVPVLVTPGSGNLRARMAAQLASEGAMLATATCFGMGHVDPGAEYGAGSLCVPHLRISPNVRIGAMAQILGAVLGHDVEIGANTSVGFGATVLGHVKIGANVVIAPGAILMNGTRARPLSIGDGAVIGIGAAVMRDVAPGARMVGNPAIPLRDWVRLQRLLKTR